MNNPRESRTEFRCTCSRQCVLGVYGINEDGLLYFHQMVRKQTQIKGQSYTTEDISVWCHLCHRWWHLKLSKNQKPHAKEINVPAVLVAKKSA